MAKKSTKAIEKYSAGDQCLIALLSEPIQTYKTKQPTVTKIKKSEELLRSIIYSELVLNGTVSSPTK